MPSSELHYLSIERSAELMRRRELSPVELTEAALARIEQLDERLGIFITVTSDQARLAARQAEAEIRRGEYFGPLHGVPVSVKDLYNTAGVRTTYGARITANFVPDEDATAVSRLRQAGAILLGKTNLHEFAFGPTGINPHYSTTRNPWDPQRVPGGSSGGSGVAVAVGIGGASLGTDTGGSIRLPAALCGVVGLKPTYGRISRHGVFPLAYSLDHVGPLTRTVRDAAFVLDAIAGHDLRDPTSSELPAPDLGAALNGQVGSLRAGVLQQCLVGLDPEVAAGFDRAVEQLRNQGLAIQPLSVPEADHAMGASTAVLFPEAAAVHHRWLAERPEEYGPDVRGRLELAALIPAVHYLKGQTARAAIVAAFERIWHDFDVLLVPTAPIAAPLIADQLENHVRNQLLANTRLFNILGAPACSIPCGFTSTGLPIGLTIAGRAFDEASVLEVALAYERSTDWHLRRPQLD